MEEEKDHAMPVEAGDFPAGDFPMLASAHTYTTASFSRVTKSKRHNHDMNACACAFILLLLFYPFYSLTGTRTISEIMDNRDHCQMHFYIYNEDVRL